MTLWRPYGKDGPTLLDLAQQAWSSTDHGYDLLAPRFDHTPFRTPDDVVARALDAYETLTALGEDVEDEWSYVNDLSSAWRDRLDEVVASRGGGAVDPTVEAAVDAACAEIGRLSDPHRAIDWLSTFPQIVLIALGEQP